MSLSAIGISAILNIGCNFATDMLKEFGKRPRQKTIENELGKYLEEFTDLETDSGSFLKFLNSTENKVNFKEFIRYRAYKKVHNESDKKNILTKEVFVEKISKQAHNFVQKDIGKDIPIKSIEIYFNRLIQVIEKKLLENLSEENLSSLYFIKQSLNEMEMRIIQSLSDRNPEAVVEDYENIRNIYLKIIKKRSKTSHVYGVDELDMDAFYVFPKLSIENNKIIGYKGEPHIEWLDVFVESNIVSIIGGAGFGKSLFLRNLINKHNELTVFEANTLLPIFCDLKKFKTLSKGQPSFSINDFLVQSMIDFTGMDKEDINKSFLKYFLEAGRCLILFDALDEVNKDFREELNEKISAFFESTNLNNKVCITSRASGFTPKTRITYKVNPIDTKEVNEYLDKMISLKFFKKGDKSDFINQCMILINNGFLVSFLQLSLLVNIFKAEKELPENRIDLYEKCIDYISRKREKDQKKSSFDFKIINSILDNDGSFEKLSSLSKPNNNEVNEKEIKSLLLKRYRISYSNENETLNAIDEFLRFCSQRTELYVEGTKEGFYKFYHRSFFEFFYSKFLIKETLNLGNLLDEILKYDVDSELFEITTSLLKKYYDDRYIEFINEVVSRITVMNLNLFEDREIFTKYSLMMIPVNEVEFTNKYYNFCFNQDRNLAYFNEENDRDVINGANILPLILKSKSHSKIIKDSLNFYKEEIIAAYFFLNIPVKANVNITLSFLFARLNLEIIGDENEEFKTILQDYDVDTIYNLLDKYSEKRNEKKGEIISKKRIKAFLTKLQK